MSGRSIAGWVGTCLAAAGLQLEAAQAVLPYTHAATVSRLDATVSDGQVRVRWTTTLELGVKAFRVLRQRDGAAAEAAEVGFVRSRDDEAGGAYELADPAARAGDRLRYELRIQSLQGAEVTVGQWEGTVGESAPAPRAAAPASVAAAPPATATATLWIGAGERVRPWTDGAPADRVRLSLREEGLYRVSAQELADASGWGVAVVEAAIVATNLSLSCQGSPVAWHAEGSNLLFYGLPAESRFAPENVYWVEMGIGSAMPPRVITQQIPATTNEWFLATIARQGTGYLARVSYSSLADSPAPYVAFPGPLLAGGNKQYIETLTDCATGVWTGTVTVNLLSYYEAGADTHTTRVSIGSAALGESSWSNEQFVSFAYPFSSTNLTGSNAALRVDNIAIAPPVPATDYTRFLCMSYGFSYARRYRAHNGALRCTGGADNTVAVSGFSSNDILVLDVTVTNLPGVVEPVTVTYDAVSGDWVAAFPCEGGGPVYHVCSKSAGVLEPSVRGVRDVDWSASENAVDYAVLVPPEAWRDGFRQALQPLADFRNAQGLRTAIVDVESVYNRYSHGLVDPLAIRAFCTAGRTSWAHPLRYVLLAGAGALDFKHQRLSVTDYTACLIPPLIAGQRFASGEGMTVATDAALGDVDGDGVPEVAVGRLPTTKTQDLAVVVQKTIAYEGALPWKQQISLSSDWENTGTKYYPFNAGTDRLVDPMTNAGRTVVKHYITASDSGAVVRVNSLFPALGAGSGVFHFFGHTDEQNLGGGTSKLLRINDVSDANWQKPTIVVILGCRPNRWQSLTTTICIVPGGLFAAGAGFVAGLGATGFMLGDESENLAVSLYTNAAKEGTLRLGDVWRRGLQEMAGTTPAERLLSYSLVGDPTLVFRHDVSAMGTPVSWLVEHGLVAPNADLADQDLDGWLTWQEYEGGTSPTQQVLRIVSACLDEDTQRMAIAFETNSNRMYRVEHTASLLSTDEWQAAAWAWTNAAGWTPAETGINPRNPVTSVDVPVSGTETQRFYRVHELN